jgi:hypothetical protein
VRHPFEDVSQSAADGALIRTRSTPKSSNPSPTSTSKSKSNKSDIPSVKSASMRSKSTGRIRRNVAASEGSSGDSPTSKEL